MKVMIISQPKSGTYLLSNVLALMGIHQSYLHLSLDRYQQYDPERLAEGRNDPAEFTHKEDLAVSVRLVKPGSFAVTHAQCNIHTIEYFSEFKKIFVYRDAEGMRNSWGRFINTTNREITDPLGLQMDTFNLMRWKNVPGVFSINFSDMIGKNTEKLDQLQMHLFGEIRHDSLSVMEQALRMDSLTKSHIRKGFKHV